MGIVDQGINDMCKCEGPFVEYDRFRWNWGGKGRWMRAVKDCPLHGYQGGDPGFPRVLYRRKRDPKPFSQFYA